MFRDGQKLARIPPAMTNSANPVSDDHLVWYAVYGSNLLRKRFDCYIQGGKPKGAAKDYPGCRDRACHSPKLQPTSFAAVTLLRR